MANARTCTCTVQTHCLLDEALPHPALPGASHWPLPVPVGQVPRALESTVVTTTAATCLAFPTSPSPDYSLFPWSILSLDDWSPSFSAPIHSFQPKLPSLQPSSSPSFPLPIVQPLSPCRCPAAPEITRPSVILIHHPPCPRLSPPSYQLSSLASGERSSNALSSSPSDASQHCFHDNLHTPHSRWPWPLPKKSTAPDNGPAKRWAARPAPTSLTSFRRSRPK